MRGIISALTLVVMTMSGCSTPPPPKAEQSSAKAPAPAPSYRALERLEASGTLEGRVNYAGETTDAPVVIDRDKATCGAAGEGPSGALVVNEGRVSNVVVEVLGVKEGIGFEPRQVKVDNVGCVFVPRVALARVGDIFVSHNSDPVFHNAKLDLMSKGKSKRIANLPVPLQGSTSPERTLKKPGVVKVSCDAHLWMRSTLYVTEHPYTALSDASGSFKIQDLPPGSYRVKLWHEVLGEKESEVTIEKGKVARLDLSF